MPKKINPGFILPSAAYTISKSQVKYRDSMEKAPEVGDLVYGRVLSLGAHAKLENKEGRIHSISTSSRAVFVYGTRYAPDAYEGIVPDSYCSEVDLVARSGIVGKMTIKNSNSLNCTKIKVLGYVCDENGEVINTLKYPKIKKGSKKKTKAKMILCVGSAMNSGKSYAAAKCCWALSSAGHLVKASKVTGTASLKDILLMEDLGASEVGDFSLLGHPSTYLLDDKQLINTFNTLDNRFGRHSGYWVVEFADGIFQRETEMLLKSDAIRQRIHKLVFCAHDAAGVIGGLKVFKEELNLVPDAISGFCSSSPLAIREFSKYTDIPVFDSMSTKLEDILPIII